jgi:uncharacterized protein
MPDMIEENPKTLSRELAARYDGLKCVLRGYGRMAVAFSGGVDSALLAYAAREALGDDMVCVIAVSPSLGERQYRDAVAFLERHRIPFQPIRTRESEDERYRSNGPNRCYYCKSELFDAIRRDPSLERFPRIAYGANLDDASDHRPGARAASESGVIAPLTEAGYGKRLIRETARELGLEVWDKPAAPCLASRIPYFSEVTPEKLRQIERAESAVKDAGFHVCRVRHHGEVARIEVPAADHERLRDPSVWDRIDARVRAAGFDRVEIEADGFRSGRLNDILGGRTRS